MRIAILVLSILGSVISLGLGAISLACAGCQGSCASMTAGAPGPAPGPMPKGASHPPGMTPQDVSKGLEMLAYSNLAASLGQILMAVLVLVGGIIAFVKLGRGEPAKVSAILMISGVSLAILAHGVGLIIVSQIDNAFVPNTSEQFISHVIFALAGLLMPAVATGLTFFAKPNEPTPQVVVTQYPGNYPHG